MRVYGLFCSMQFTTSVGTEWVDNLIGVYAKYDDATWDADQMEKKNKSGLLKGVYFVRGFDVREEKQL
jgi:hypothetical protein